MEVRPFEDLARWVVILGVIALLGAAGLHFYKKAHKKAPQVVAIADPRAANAPGTPPGRAVHATTPAPDHAKSGGNAGNSDTFQLDQNQTFLTPQQ